MTKQKYIFLIFLFLFSGAKVWAQCLSLPHAINQQFETSTKIIEGKVVNQRSFVDANGNIYTSNSINVYRVFKGDVGLKLEVITEGGVFGDLMQVVTPSAQMQIGDYGVMVLANDSERSLISSTSAFYPVDEKSGNVYGLKNISKRETLYEKIARSTETETIELRRIPLEILRGNSTKASRANPEISSIYPLEVTAGTQTVLTITGQGFGIEQGTGRVAFRNADDGGQSFVTLPAGPHYLSWSDTEIQMYVPSTTLYSTTVAGSGSIRIIDTNGQSIESTEQISVNYAKSEVIYSEQLNSTMLVGMQSGGYEFKMNEQLMQFINGSSMVEDVFLKWACNTGINFKLDDEIVNLTDWAHDDINLIGLSNPGQIPSSLLGKTITTFSGCGTPNGLQWNLIEVDILLNSDIEWWTSVEQPESNKFDLETAVIHEMGHAHLLQHNNNLSSPMYFQLNEGSMRRDLFEPSIEGGNYVSTQSVETISTCGEELHEYFDVSTCDLSEINGIEEESINSISVHPNPFNNQITLSGEWKRESQYSIFDATGREVLNGNLNSSMETITTDQLSNGIYLLEVRDDTKSSSQRLVKN
ncbi:MAG: hypothetical protein ACJAYA_000113 [Bacteroidia bacterium]